VALYKYSSFLFSTVAIAFATIGCSYNGNYGNTSGIDTISRKVPGQRRYVSRQYRGNTVRTVWLLRCHCINCAEKYDCI